MIEQLKILRNILGDSYKSGNETLFHCPYCNHHKKKLSINIDKNAYQCWICGQGGKDIYRVVRRFGNYKQKERWRDIMDVAPELTRFGANMFNAIKGEDSEEIQVVPLPEGFKSLSERSRGLPYRQASSYLTKRGITKQDALWWRMGYCATGEYKNRIIVPSFDVFGNINYFVARSFDGHPRRYLNPPVSRNIIFNELMINFDKEVVIVEGVFDAIKAGKNAIPILGSMLTEKGKLFKRIVENDTPVILALDSDAKKKSQRIKKLFLKYGIEVREVNVQGYEDVGDMSKEEFIKILNKATFITQADYLQQAISNIAL